MTISTKSWVLAGALVVAGVAGVGFALTDPEPNLCDIDDGAWCEPCGDKGEPECPAGASGWLCCSENTGQKVCVASGLVECSGPGLVWGWCSNYTEDPVSGAATCHD